MNAYQLKRFRQSRKLTQQQLADRFGISRNLLSMYERKVRDIPEHINKHIQDIRRLEELELRQDG